jgi:hypothetical protein
MPIREPNPQPLPYKGRGERVPVPPALVGKGARGYSPTGIQEKVHLHFNYAQLLITPCKGDGIELLYSLTAIQAIH